MLAEQMEAADYRRAQVAREGEGTWRGMFLCSAGLIEAVKGNLEEGLFFCGANVGRLDRMYTVRELMDELVTEWRQNR